MYDLKTGSQTQLATTKIKYDIGITKDLFTKRALSDSSLEKPFEL